MTKRGQHDNAAPPRACRRRTGALPRHDRAGHRRAGHDAGGRCGVHPFHRRRGNQGRLSRRHPRRASTSTAKSPAATSQSAATATSPSRRGPCGCPSVRATNPKRRSPCCSRWSGGVNSRAGGYGSVTPRERRDAPDAYLIADFRFSPSFARKSCVFLHAWSGPISAAVPGKSHSPRRPSPGRRSGPAIRCLNGWPVAGQRISGGPSCRRSWRTRLAMIIGHPTCSDWPGIWEMSVNDSFSSPGERCRRAAPLALPARRCDKALKPWIFPRSPGQLGAQRCKHVRSRNRLDKGR